MYAVMPRCTHTYSGANEALGDRTYLKTFLCLLASVYVYLCMNLCEAHRIHTVHTGHLTRRGIMLPFTTLVYPVCVFPAFSHYYLCILLSPESVKHGELLEYSCLEKSQTRLSFSKKNNSRLITACSLTANVHPS